MKKIIFWVISFFLTLCACIVLAEAMLRINPYNTFKSARELDWIRKSYNSSNVYTIDPAFGFRPILGDKFYNAYGTKVNNYNINKTEDTTRLLFIGDSVTAKGYIIDGLRQLYGEDGFEYWNAGVGSFNTVQELKFFKKYNILINPDKVILTFHLNDFETTPVAFFNEKNQLIVFAPNIPSKDLNSFLFKNSMLYRLYLRFYLTLHRDKRNEIIKETEGSLKELRDILDKREIDFTVLVLPILLPLDKWHPQDMKTRERILAILQKLKIRYFDLTEVIDTAVKDGINMRENDIHHPDREMGFYFAKYLKEKGLLKTAD